MLAEFIASVKEIVLQFSDVEFLVITIIASAIGLYSFYQMVKRHHISRLIENTPTSKIRSAAQGYVELNGKAKLLDGDIIISPLSTRQCVWYRYKIEEEYEYHDSKGNTVRGWRVIKSATSDDLFLIEDDTGKCIIDPDDADVVTTDKRVWYDRSLLRSRRYTEELITQNEPLYAIGLFKTIDRTQRLQFKRHVSELLRQWKKSPNLLLLKYDRDNNGQLSEQEWQQVRLAAEKQIQHEYGKNYQQEALNLLAMTQNKDHSFILSTLSEEKLIKRFQLHVMGYILTFFVMGSLVIWAINVRLGA
ncbi:MAG: E3 ubiquitin ligase family protein [Methylococcaceae bacterium]|nr:E3 ubiquitin ligase family protein [Methylococcaceae bacterium]